MNILLVYKNLLLMLVSTFGLIMLPNLSAQANSCHCESAIKQNVKSLLADYSLPNNSMPVPSNNTILRSGTEMGIVQGQLSKEDVPVNILFLIDSSFSMKEKLGGSEPKMTSAKLVLENALARIPPEINIGLRVFGQSYTGSPEIDCQQTSLLVQIGNGNRRSIIEQVRQLHPFGLTPLTYALMQSERDFRGLSGAKTIILISDGAETCGGDPCGYIARLHAMGINIKVDIVGLGLKREREARAQLNCIAEKSGGKYYDANTSAELVNSITTMVTNAISGKVITKMKQPALNTEVSPEVTPPQ